MLEGDLDKAVSTYENLVANCRSWNLLDLDFVDTLVLLADSYVEMRVEPKVNPKDLYSEALEIIENELTKQGYDLENFETNTQVRTLYVPSLVKLVKIKLRLAMIDESLTQIKDASRIIDFVAHPMPSLKCEVSLYHGRLLRVNEDAEEEKVCQFIYLP